jgi:hypothetical protein
MGTKIMKIGLNQELIRLLGFSNLNELLVNDTFMTLLNLGGFTNINNTTNINGSLYIPGLIFLGTLNSNSTTSTFSNDSNSENENV